MTRTKNTSPFIFQPFSDKQMKLLTWWQDNSPVRDKFMIVSDGSIRSGKSQYVELIVPTPTGMRRWGDLRSGDYVFDRHGKKTKILEIYPQGKLDLYKIAFSDGSNTICSKQHLWSYTTHKCITNGNKTVFTSTLEDIMKDLEKYKDRDTMAKRAGKYRFPLNGCVEFEKREVSIDPYLLGLMLGDGCFSLSSSIQFTNDEIELHKIVEEKLKETGCGYTFREKDKAHCARGYVTNISIFRDLLNYYGLYGKLSYDKFVPEDYKINSIDVRLNILAGLLNTDGSVHLNKPSISFCSVSKQLVDDVAFLARSLGMWVNTDRYVDVREKNKHDCYSCCIRVNNMLYEKLSEKHKSRLKMDAKKQKNWRMIKSIEYYGKEEATCILVDNEEHLYLCNDFIVTHNTVVCALSFILYLMTHFNYQNAAMCGKAQPLYSNILTPNGYKKMGDINIDDYVYNRKGKPVKVSGIFPQGERDCYRITFNDGSSTDCSLDHLWTFYDKGELKTKTLKEIKNSYYRDYRFPLNECIDFQDKELGMFAFPMGEIIAKYDIGIQQEIGKEFSGIVDKYIVYRNDKICIPDDYKYNSSRIRQDIMCGIINTAYNNGMAFIDTHYITYCTHNKELLRDIVFIARSLGLFVIEKFGSCRIYVDSKLKYDLLGVSSLEPIDITTRKITDIKYIGKEKCQCIYVDDDEHLYLTDDLIVTHNTVMSVRRNVLNPLKQMLVSLDYDIIDHRNENYVEIIKDDICNFVYLFGGRKCLCHPFIEI